MSLKNIVTSIVICGVDPLVYSPDLQAGVSIKCGRYVEHGILAGP